MKLLITDDNELNREMAEDILEDMGVSVLSADSGVTCLRMLSEVTDIDAILMDYMMPEMDGAETSVKVHEIKGYENLPIIAMTAEENPEIIKVLLESGMSTVLHKPVDPRELYVALNEYTDEELKEPERTSDEEIEKDEVLNKLEKAGFDVKAGIKYTGSLKNYKLYASDFLRMLPGMLESLDELMNTGDYENFTVNIHGLKSNFRALGNTSLFKKSRKSEELGKKGAFEELKSAYENDRPVYYECCESLVDIFGTKELLPEFSAKELKIALKELRDAMKTFDLDTADAIVSDLETHKAPEDIAGEMNKLYREVTLLKYEASVETAESLLKALEER